MSTKMDENDWAHTLAVFRACLPRRGRKAADDRRFLEALHFFTRHRLSRVVGGEVEIAVGQRLASATEFGAVVCSLPRASLLAGAGFGSASRLAEPRLMRTRFRPAASRA